MNFGGYAMARAYSREQGARYSVRLVNPGDR